MSTAPEIKGWCPGAHRPMMSGDGLVVRVRPYLTQLNAVQAVGLADLADEFGSGVLELTSRANLQIRGVSDTGYPLLMAGLGDLGLLDESAEAEARRNILLTPFRSTDTPAQIAQGLAQGLAAPDMPKLPAKFGFVVEGDAGQTHLRTVSGDIRIESAEAGMIVRADGATLGRRVDDPAQAVDLAVNMARWFVSSGGVGADGRGRMHQHLAQAAQLPPDLAGDAAPAPVAAPPEPGLYGAGQCIAAGFGQLSTLGLRALAQAGCDLRITPFRMIYLPMRDLPRGVAQCPDLITTPDDPLLRVVACTGAPGCPQAQIKTRALARTLAPRVAKGHLLHVTGCAKGCAHPACADTTLVGRDGRLDLVENGQPWQEPAKRALSVNEILDLEEF